MKTLTAFFALLLSVCALASASIVGHVTGAIPAGETVYLDQNNNHGLDAGELSAVVAPDGSYTFPTAPSGVPLIVRQVLPAGYVQKFPGTPAGHATYGIHVTVNAGQVLTGQNFVDAVSLQPAVVVAQPAVVPVLKLGLGSLPFAPPMAPATVHVSLFGSTFAAGDWRCSVLPTLTTAAVYRTYSIVVTDSTGATVYTAASPQAAPILAAGTYAITGSIDGYSASTSVTIPSDTRAVTYLSSIGNDAATGTAAAPRKSLDALTLTGNQTIALRYGDTYPTAKGVPLAAKHNIRFAAYGDSTLPLPVIMGSSGNLLSMSTDEPNAYTAPDLTRATVDVTFANVKFDGAWTPTTKSTGPYHNSACSIGATRGVNIAFDGCQFGNLQRAFDLETILGGCVRNCTLTDPTGITSQGLYAGGATSVVITGSSFINGVGNEAAFRITEYNNTEWWVDNCLMEVLPGCNGKATGTIRQGLRLYFSNIRSVGDIFSSDQDHTGVQYTDSSLFRNIQQSGVGYFQVRNGPRSCIYQGIQSTVQYGPAISINSAQGSANVFDGCSAVVQQLSPSGPNADCAMKFFVADSSAIVRGLAVTGPKGVAAIGGAAVGWAASGSTVVNP